MVYVLKFTDADDEQVLTFWNSELDASKTACNSIHDYISNAWDISQTNQFDDAKEFNRFVKSGCYSAAIRHWNQCKSNVNSSYFQHWDVYKDDMNSNTVVPKVWDDSYFGASTAPIKYLTLSKDPADMLGLPSVAEKRLLNKYSAAECGATCRGHCGTYNEYAYADNPDGTYVCFGCKTK